MRSSTGQHYVGLDHIRGLAAYMVVCWHFLHFNNGVPVSFEGTPLVFPLALLDEGHTGVALFMVLSGYLFAKLLDGKNISYPAFFWNRFIRLAPMLGLVFLLVVVDQIWSGQPVLPFLLGLPKGLVYPSWPNGGWSVTTEIHFYLLLPLLLALVRRARWLPLLVLAAALALRAGLYVRQGEVQSLAYWTILGRIDQFLLGILAYLYGPQIARQRVALGVGLVAFVAFWWVFDRAGGFYQMPVYPSKHPVWIVLPTLEGLAYGGLIAWYDRQPVTGQGLVSRILQKCGEYSYSIYLLHFFVVFRVSHFVHQELMDISSLYLALPWATGFFLLMLIPGYLSYRFVESPFLRLRTHYLRPGPATLEGVAVDAGGAPRQT